MNCFFAHFLLRFNFTINNINVGDIKQFDIPFPNIEQQNCIVALIEEKFSVCDSIERMVDNALAEANVMRQSILKKAFKGGFSE